MVLRLRTIAVAISVRAAPSALLLGALTNVVVLRLRAAAAVIIGKTQMTEFAF